MINGKVQIFKVSESGEETLVQEDRNMIVDGAGELIAFMMTIPPDGYSVSPRIYDASNFSIRSVSFGKDQRAYLKNMHSTSGITATGRQTGKYWALTSSVTASSYSPNLYLPDAPTPIDTKLQNFTNETLLDSTQVCAVYCNALEGQNVNLIDYYAYVPDDVFGISVSSMPLSAILAAGCYAPSTAGRLVEYRYDNGTASGQLVASATTTGVLNNTNRKVVDCRGYFRRVEDSGATIGFLVSATSGFNSLGVAEEKYGLVSSLEIITRTTLSQADVRFVHIYGGITTMGAWVFDFERMLSEGNYPPYDVFSVNTGTTATSQLDHTGKIKYKLFAKKVFQEDITKSLDSGTYAGINHAALTLYWRFYFK
jgi:hypothetical protein